MTTATSDIPVKLAAAPAVAVTSRRGAGALTRIAAAYDLAKPRVNFMVVVTTAVGCHLAAGAAGIVERPWLFVNALLGTALTAGGASALNQFLERKQDALMIRTAQRPLPAGNLPPAFALSMGVVLGALGTVWLGILVNPLTAALGLGTLLLYVLVYTPLKRHTPLCTIIGAVPGAIPPMMGVTAFTGEITPAAWALFAILFVWQMPHFYGLALLFRDDYARGGFAMLPSQPNGLVRTGRQSVGFALLLLPISLLPAVLGISGWYYAAAAVALGIWFLTAAIACWRTLAQPEARRLFLTSILYLPLLLVAMMLDKQ